MAIIGNNLLVLHAKNPEFYGLLPDATHSATIDNASCGDSVSVNCRVVRQTIERAGFSSRGCMLCKAATSILLGHVIGKTIWDVGQLTDDDLLSMLGTSEISYSRRKCALMCIEALRSMFGVNNNQ